jgi:hypothetical protein
MNWTLSKKLRRYRALHRSPGHLEAYKRRLQQFTYSDQSVLLIVVCTAVWEVGGKQMLWAEWSKEQTFKWAAELPHHDRE